MWKATIRGLFARKVRLALAALAILLGVAFVSATYLLTNSVKRSFNGVFTQEPPAGSTSTCRGPRRSAGSSSPGRIPRLR